MLSAKRRAVCSRRSGVTLSVRPLRMQPHATPRSPLRRPVRHLFFGARSKKKTRRGPSPPRFLVPYFKAQFCCLLPHFTMCRSFVGIVTSLIGFALGLKHVSPRVPYSRRRLDCAPRLNARAFFLARCMYRVRRSAVCTKELLCTHISSTNAESCPTARFAF